MAGSYACIVKLFRDARTHSAWLDKRVSDETLRDLYDALKWGPTSANASPARFVFIRTGKAKERLRPSLAPGNVEKTMVAPVTVIVAYDLQFYEKLPKLFPHNPGMRDLFAANPALIEVTARRNSSLQGAYLILAACAGDRLRADVRLRQRKAGRGVFRRGQGMRRLRAGVLSGRAREVQLPVQSRLRRSIEALATQSAPGIQRGVYADVSVLRTRVFSAQCACLQVAAAFFAALAKR